MDFLFEPASPFKLFGYFDFLILASIIVFNFVVLKFNYFRNPNWFFKFIVFIVLIFILPSFSMLAEDFLLGKRLNDPEFWDSFYVFFRIMILWVIGFIEIVILHLILIDDKK